MRRHLLAALAIAASLTAADAHADGPKVVASIKPVHSLVAGLMAGVGTPDLIVKGAASPHTFSLRPSDAKAIADADLVVWVGEGLERPIADAIEALAPKTKVVELMELDKLHRRKGHHHHDDEEKGHKHEHEHAKKEEKHGGHDHEEIDPHVWLDPENAHVTLAAVADALVAIDPKNAAAYRANLAKMNEKLDAMEADLEKSLKPVADKPFIVFHDAYGYFTERFDLGPATAVTVNPERKPGAKRVAEVRAVITDKGATCIFAEPQFSPAILKTIAEGTKIRTGVLDPLGADLKDGPELYFTLIGNLGKSIRACVGG